MIIIILIGAIILGIFLAGLLAPIIMIANKKRLKEMDQKISTFENQQFTTPEEKEKAKQILKKELIKIKAKITSDKKSITEASDKISIL